MKPAVNQESCIGCGTCEAICPDVFKVQEVDSAMKAVVLAADYAVNKDKIDEASGSCPTQAISWAE